MKKRFLLPLILLSSLVACVTLFVFCSQTCKPLSQITCSKLGEIVKAPPPSVRVTVWDTIWYLRIRKSDGYIIMAAQATSKNLLPYFLHRCRHKVIATFSDIFEEFKEPIKSNNFTFSLLPSINGNGPVNFSINEDKINFKGINSCFLSAYSANRILNVTLYYMKPLSGSLFWNIPSGNKTKKVIILAEDFSFKSKKIKTSNLLCAKYEKEVICKILNKKLPATITYVEIEL